MNGFLSHGPAEARWNMAVDNWLACQAPLVSGEIVVRLYCWSPGAISVGRNQLWQRAFNLSALQAGQVAVRRITGGRAIYHDESELTYSIALELGAVDSVANTKQQGQASTIDKPLIRETSLKVSRALVGFLSRLNVAARIERGRTGQYAGAYKRGLPKNTAPACFESITRHEITANGRKIAAGAQRIIGTRYFQHGSIKIAGIAAHPALPGMNRDLNQFENGNNTPTEWCYSHQEVTPCRRCAAHACKAAFEEVFSCSLPEITLSTDDKAAINDRQNGLDCIIGLPDAPKGAKLTSGFGGAWLPDRGAGPVREAGSLTQNALTEKRRSA